MARQRSAGLVFGFALLALAPLALHAQAAEPFQGRYTLNAEASDNVHAAIDQAVRGMNFVTRPVARGRLRRTNDAYRQVVIGVDGGTSIQFDQRAAIVTPADGAPIRWRREDGEEFDVTTRVVQGRLEQRFVAEDGQRTNVYTLSPDGRTLTMNVTIESPRLSSPLRYKLVYDRAN